ncbi:hypothetical protein AWENTII_001358 [Aspergillus wentii]|nr:hypothetical protein MW887_001368 [Aspergillus wentii]
MYGQNVSILRLLKTLESLVQFCSENGACVCFGDIAFDQGENVAEKCCSSNPSTTPQALFHQTDVTDYHSVLGLFDTAFKTYGRIDHAVAGAGILDNGNGFDPELTLESFREPPSQKVLDVNLIGCLYTARIASVYPRQNQPDGADRSILLISSSCGFKEAAGFFFYQASEHGVLGVMRALRGYIPLPSRHNTRVNAICP